MTGEPRGVDDQILDAARTCVLEFGVRRTTLAEIARRAGVSRPTVYRRWPDTSAIVADLLTREIGLAMPSPSGAGNMRAQLVLAVAEMADTVRTHPLFVKILRSDPELLITYIVDRLGASQRAIIEHLVPVVAAGQADGSIRAGDPTVITTMVLLMTQSAVQSAGMVAELVPPDVLVTELTTAVDAYLTARS
ncbi:TetR/AcrR family transcriptional regulator [Rhodococcus olei]|uniref:TetR/AcrR family transcriptional regulator n=1 Tax=Rhodococcus olei TaxID=2161675 RepID=A0ABP8NWZ6_9NOCA